MVSKIRINAIVPIVKGTNPMMLVGKSRALKEELTIFSARIRA